MKKRKKKIHTPNIKDGEEELSSKKISCCVKYVIFALGVAQYEENEEKNFWWNNPLPPPQFPTPLHPPLAVV